jgi:hypothetical protein
MSFNMLMFGFSHTARIRAALVTGIIYNKHDGRGAWYRLTLPVKCRSRQCHLSDADKCRLSLIAFGVPYGAPGIRAGGDCISCPQNLSPEPWVPGCPPPAFETRRLSKNSSDSSFGNA